MRPHVLCRERLDRLLAVLERQGGKETLRQLSRRFGLHVWEVEQAAALGWVRVKMEKPCIGRPSQKVEKLSKTEPAKLPPYRREIPTRVSHRHYLFALYSTCASVARGASIGPYILPPTVEAYRRVYSSAKSRGGAASSCSRLLRHPHVRAARQWFYAHSGREIPSSEQMPATPGAIWQRLHDLGNWRAQWAPRGTIT